MINHSYCKNCKYWKRDDNSYNGACSKLWHELISFRIDDILNIKSYMLVQTGEEFCCLKHELIDKTYRKQIK